MYPFASEKALSVLARFSKNSYWRWIVFWFSLQRSSKRFLILRRTERDVIKHVYCSSRKVPDILVRF